MCHMKNVHSCGEKVIFSDVTKTLYQKIKNEEFVKKLINIPVLEGPMVKCYYMGQ